MRLFAEGMSVAPPGYRGDRETMSKQVKFFADAQTSEGREIVLHVNGKRPEHRPYLRVGTTSGAYIASVGHPRTLKALADRIYEALGHTPQGDQ